MDHNYEEMIPITVNEVKWRDLLNQKSAELGLKIESDCNDLNDKDNTRFFHADCSSKEFNDNLWRLKVVNEFNVDKLDIEKCCRYNNDVHKALEGTSTLRSIIRIPRCFPLMKDFNKVVCSELIKGDKSDIKDIPRIVEMLTNLQTKRHLIVTELQKSSLNEFKRTQYYERLIDTSGKKLVEKDLLNNNQLDSIKKYFNKLFPNELKLEDLTFVHGDFSFGNMVVDDHDKLFLIDFEHSHIGSGLIDLAHLYVNLDMKGDIHSKDLLIDKYITENKNFDGALFKALVLERAAGKLNSMKPGTNRNYNKYKEQLLDLLLNPKGIGQI
jgi:thiamine kinase-like enzyme